MSIQELKTGDYRITQTSTAWCVEVVDEDGAWVPAEPRKQHATEADANKALEAIRAQNERDFLEGFAEGMGIPVGDAGKVLRDNCKGERQKGWSRGFEYGMECRLF